LIQSFNKRFFINQASLFEGVEKDTVSLAIHKADARFIAAKMIAHHFLFYSTPSLLMMSVYFCLLRQPPALFL
jgi:hypothetical protein